jgi:3',5'-cyclic AMP phosphodiesterase CpdA
MRQQKMKRFLLLSLLSIPELNAQTVLVKPYIQPGDASAIGTSDSRVLTWVTDAKSAVFQVSFSFGETTKTAIPTATPLDFAKYTPPRAQPNSTTPSAVETAPSQPATTLDQLKKAVADAFPAIIEREQHYIRYRAILPDLPLNSEVRWKVTTRTGQTIREGITKTKISPGNRTRFVAVGDMASNKPEAFGVAYRISESHPDFLIALGDIVYPGGRAIQYMNHFFPVYNDVTKPSPRTGAPLMASIPFYPVVGNHDADSQRLPNYADAFSCFHWFTVPKNGPGEGPWNTPLGKDASAAEGFRKMAGPEYPAMCNYSFDYGDGHFLVLDANGYAAKDMNALLPWIERDLGASNQRWKFVSFHHPAFHTSKEHYTEQRMRLLQPLFERTGVDLVLAGHVHNYQRSLPLRFTPNPEGRDKRGRVNGSLALDREYDGVSNTRPNGVIHLVSGGGGAKLYSLDLQKTVEQLMKDHPDNYQPLTAKYVPEHSFTVFDMTSDELAVEQINLEGKVVDSFRVTKPARQAPEKPVTPLPAR